MFARSFICSVCSYVCSHTHSVFVHWFARAFVPLLIWSCHAQVTTCVHQYMYGRALEETGSSWQLRRNEEAWKWCIKLNWKCLSTTELETLDDFAQTFSLFLNVFVFSRGSCVLLSCLCVYKHTHVVLLLRGIAISPFSRPLLIMTSIWDIA